MPWRADLAEPYLDQASLNPEAVVAVRMAYAASFMESCNHATFLVRLASAKSSS